MPPWISGGGCLWYFDLFNIYLIPFIAIADPNSAADIKIFYSGSQWLNLFVGLIRCQLINCYEPLSYLVNDGL